MKKIILYTVVLATTLVGCSRDEERLFEKSASERAQAAITNAENILTNSENGWHMVYFANPEKKTYAHMAVKFSSNGQVEANIASGKSVKRDTASLWEVVNDICPVLTFNTYNNILHTWADPQKDGLGYEGDYEFLILEATQERVRLKGKKYGAYSVLYPMQAGEDIATITTNATKIETQIFSNGNLLEYRDGNKVYTLFNDGLLRFAAQGKMFEVEDPYMPVASMQDGIQIMGTMTGAANTNRHFVLKEDGLLHAESATIVPSTQYVYNYMKLMGRGWTLNLNEAIPVGLDSIIKQINEELRDMAGQKGSKRKAKILNLRLNYNEDIVYGQQIITYLMELKYTDNKTEYGHIYYEFNVDFSGENFTLTYLKPHATEEGQAEFMLEKVPTLKTLFNALGGTYSFTATTAINPSLGGTMVHTDASKNISIQASGTEK